MNRLIKYMEEKREVIEKALDKNLPRQQIKPGVLHEAMRYSVFGNGKRLRPLLCLMGCEVCGGSFEDALPAACALEFVHTYSLIHDDLPAMDNDDMRRGKLTCHKAFDQATAILAGDALLTLAFEMLAKSYPENVAAKSVLALSKAAGHHGMVGGQMLDIEGEGADPDIDKVNAIHKWKTGALISASCTVGGIVGGGDEEKLESLNNYGRSLGLLFQIADDVLDIEATSEELGKTAGKDAKQKKLTYPAVMGLQEAKEAIKDTAAEAKRELKSFDKEAIMLRLLADYLVDRKK